MPVIKDFDIGLQLNEVDKLKSLSGSGSMHPRIRGMLPEILECLHKDKLVAPGISYEIMKVDAIQPGFITLDGGGALKSPLLSHRLARASSMSFSVATIGASIGKTIRQWFTDGRHVRAFVLEEIANALLFKVLEQMRITIETQAEQMGLTTSGPLSPGDHHGFDIDQQETVLTIAGASKLGISLTATNQMDPVHSVSVVTGIGKKIKKWSRMDNCSICRARDKCVHRLNFEELTA